MRFTQRSIVSMSVVQSYECTKVKSKLIDYIYDWYNRAFMPFF